MGFLKKLGVFIVGNMILSGICYGVSNLMEGKDILGRKRRIVPKKETYVDYKGRIIMGANDYQVN